MRNKKCYQVPIDEIIALFEIVGNDYSSVTTYKWKSERKERKHLEDFKVIAYP